MSPQSEWLRDDAASLYRFIDSVCAYVDRSVGHPPQLEASAKFFDYIRQLGEKTREFLNRFPAGAPKDPRFHHFYRKKLETIRHGWFDFHQRIKPAVDADSLNLPVSLLDALFQRFNSIPGFEAKRFIIFHLNEVNYLQIRASEIQDTAKRLARIIPGAPNFPPDHGMIGIPYSQSTSLFMNCLIPHEIGHFVFQDQGKRDEILPEIERALENGLGPKLQQLKDKEKRWYLDRLASWAEELFCDLFGVWMVGPCYCLAYTELTGLSELLERAPQHSEATRFQVTLTEQSKRFSRSHPADVFRLKQQVLFLRNLKWWQEVRSWGHLARLLALLAVIPKKSMEFVSEEQEYPGETLTSFFRLTPLVHKLVRELTVDLDTGLASYQRFHKYIEEYLANGVVPSTVFDGNTHWYPDVISLLNASYEFYLKSLDQLVNKIEGQDVDIVEHRARWIRRLELWTAKAIEDRQLLVGERGAVKDDAGSFKRADLHAAQ